MGREWVWLGWVKLGVAVWSWGVAGVWLGEAGWGWVRLRGVVWCHWRG